MTLNMEPFPFTDVKVEQVNRNKKWQTFFPPHEIIKGKNQFPVRTRPDTRLPQSRAGGQGPYLRSVEHLGSCGIAKNPIIAEKVKCDGRTDGRTDKAGCRFA